MNVQTSTSAERIAPGLGTKTSVRGGHWCHQLCARWCKRDMFADVAEQLCAGTQYTWLLPCEGRGIQGPVHV